MPAAATIGHNSALTDGERQSLYLHHLRLIQGQRARVDAERKAEKVLRKDARNDGIVLKEIDFGMLCRSTEDETILPNEQIRRNEIMRWLGLPVGTQAEFNFKKDTMKDRARREGAAAGWGALARTPPYDAGTTEEQEWIKAYDGAQTQARDDLAAAMRKKNAERLAAARRSKSNGDAEGDDEGDEGDEDKDAA